MDSTAEFQRLEALIQSSEQNGEESFDHQSKKHKSFDESLEFHTNHGDQNNEDGENHESLEDIIASVMSQHNMKLTECHDVIGKLSERLRHELATKEELRRNENILVDELEDIKNRMKEVTTLASSDAKQRQKQYDEENNIEVCRRAAIVQPNTSLVLPHSSHEPQVLAATPHQFDSNEKKLLLGQIKDLQDKYQSERQFYLEENDRLHSINEEYSQVIEDLKNKSSSSVTNTSSVTFDIDPNASKGTANNRMLHVLSDLVKTFLDTENDIQKHLHTLGLDSTGNSSVDLKNMKTIDDSFFNQGFPSMDHDFSDLTGTDGLVEDRLTPSSLYYTTSHSLNQSTSNDVEDDVVLVASKRLRSAVERVLKILSEVVENQSHENHDLQAALQNESFCRDKLARQLIDKEGLISQLETDRKTILEQTSDYFAIKNERDQYKAKLEEYEKDHEKFLVERTKFHDEKQQFSKGLPELQKKLSKENEILNTDLTQLQQERSDLLTKINGLTQEIDTLKHEKETILEKKNAEFDDILCQIDSHEKNFHSMKKFIEEQTADRENEREEYNREIQTLKNRVKEFEKNESKLTLNVKNLEDQLALFLEEKNSKESELEEADRNSKLANMKVSELNMTIKKLEKELEENQKVKSLLRNRLKDVCQTLNLKTSERVNWDELITVINGLIDVEKNKKEKTKVQFDVPQEDSQNSSKNLLPSDEDNSVFLTINLLNNKMKILNEEIDVLIGKNQDLSKDLDDSKETIQRLEVIKEEKQILERAMFEFKKENQMLQEEINDNHLRYSELKVKLENSVDVQQFKRIVDELESKFEAEKTTSENLAVKLDQSNRELVELGDKIVAHEKEIKSYKDLLKSFETSQKNVVKEKNDFRDKFEHLNLEMNEANIRMMTKDKTITVLEQNIEMLKHKLRALSCENNVYLEKLKSMDENHNQVVVYEKNMDKLRLQHKMATDKVNYLELEINNLRKKTQILQHENEVLKVENYRVLSRSRTDPAIFDTESVAETASTNQQENYTTNIFALKARRLQAQKGSLVYQKNYLINLLDSCQSGEMDTLALLSSLNNGNNEDSSPFNESSHSRGKHRFRSAVYAVIAVQRMRFLARLWQCRKQEFMIHRSANSLFNLGNAAPREQHAYTLPNSATSRFAASTSSMSTSSTTSASSSSPSNSLTRRYPSNADYLRSKRAPTLSEMNSTMKGFVDRLHNVHETLGLQTNKL